MTKALVAIGALILAGCAAPPKPEAVFKLPSAIAGDPADCSIKISHAGAATVEHCAFDQVQMFVPHDTLNIRSNVFIARAGQ